MSKSPANIKTMQTTKIIYWVSTGLLSALMLMSASFYLFNNPAIQEAFTSLGYPTYLIYPLAIAKILGLVAIWTRRSTTLKEWAYAGFFYDTLLAASAHLAVNDGQAMGAIIGLVLVLTSYYTQGRLFKA